MSAPSLRRSDDDTQPIPVVHARGRHAAPRPARPALRWAGLIGREAGIGVAILLAAVLLVRALPVAVSYAADDAMEPTVTAGDRVVVTSLGAPAPGDIVLVRSPAAWGAPEDESLARVIGLSGQRVSCCDESGRIAIDGVAMDEPYLSGPTDQVRFDVVVPDGRIFVLADRRETARDSRVVLEVEDGTLPREDVLGRVIFVLGSHRAPIG
jgi:signal peptidase I